jgi:acyl carrier protein
MKPTTSQILTPALEWLRDHAATEADPEATLKSLDLDSLDMTECAMAIEEKLGITIHEEDLDDLEPTVTLYQWAEAVSKHCTEV